MWTTYKLPMNFTIGGGVRYVDTAARTVSNVPVTQGVFEIPSYTVVDLFASYDVNDHFSIQVNGYNVTDEDYIGKINNSGQRYIAGTPPSYLATVNFRF
jgi:catecholate siderophore receptor